MRYRSWREGAIKREKREEEVRTQISELCSIDSNESSRVERCAKEATESNDPGEKRFSSNQKAFSITCSSIGVMFTGALAFKTFVAVLGNKQQIQRLRSRPPAGLAAVQPHSVDRVAAKSACSCAPAQLEAKKRLLSIAARAAVPLVSNRRLFYGLECSFRAETL